jgi:hypothetical protein
MKTGFQKISNLFYLIGKCIVKPKSTLISLNNFIRNLRNVEVMKKQSGFENGLPTIDIENFLGSEETQLNYLTFLDGTSRITDFALLQNLCKKHNIKNYLEFGTWRGESIRNIYQHVEKCTAISFSEEEMIAHKVPKDAQDVSRLFLNSDINNFTDIKHNSQNYNFKELNQSYDLIFIDADHEYEGVKIDTANAFGILKDPLNSIIVWHDYCSSYETINYAVYRGLFEGTPEKFRNNLYKVSNSLCAIYYPFEFQKFTNKRFMPNKTFKVSLGKHLSLN